MAMARCPRCGQPASETQRFCSRCGAPLSAGGSTAPDVPRTMTPPVSPARGQSVESVAPVSLSQGDPVASVVPGTPQPPRRSGRGPLFLTIGAVLLIAVLGMGVAFASGWISLPGRASGDPAALGDGGDGIDGGDEEDEWSPNAHPTLVGEAIFVGDELDWLIPEAGQLSAVLNGSRVGDTSAEYLSVGETEGIVPRPESCWGVVRVEAVYERPAGFRRVRLGPEDAWIGAYRVTQYPTVEQARAVAEKYQMSSQQCTSYVWEGSDETWTYTSIAERNDQDVWGMASSFRPDVTGPYVEPFDEVLVRHGNVVIEVTIPPAGDEVAKNLLNTVVDQVIAAKGLLAERLTNGPQ